MNEIKRFLRYVIPGLVFVIETSLFLFFSILPCYSQILEKLPKVSNFNIILTFFIASGGIGYIFSMIYHTVYWAGQYRYHGLNIFASFFRRFLAVDHITLLKKLNNEKKINLSDFTNKRMEDISPREAWIIINSIWHSKKESSKIIKGADQRNDTLCDILHSSGTNLISFFIAGICWPLLHKWIKNSWPCFISWTTLLILILFIFHIGSYFIALKNAQGFAEKVLDIELKHVSPIILI